MQILKTDLKHGFVHVKIEHPEDLWYLSHIINPGDLVRGTTERKIKIGGEDARNQKVVRKKMTLTLRAEKIEYTKSSLRVLGVITDGPDDIPRGEYHSLVFQEGDAPSITKQKWLSWQLDKLKEASEGPKEKIMVLLFDRETALFALLNTQGHQVLSSMKGNVQKKDVEEYTKSNFYKELVKQLSDYDARYKTKSIIAASPAFWKDYLKKELTDELARKVIYATVSDTDESSLSELVRRPELKSALERDRSAKELSLVEDLLKAVSKDMAAYGIKEVEAKVSEGALKNILVSENLLMKLREEDGYDQLDSILKSAESGNADISIITTDEATKTLDGLGGIAGVRRW